MEMKDSEKNKASKRSKDFLRQKETPCKTQNIPVRSAVADNLNKFPSIKVPPGFQELPPPAFETPLPSLAFDRLPPLSLDTLPPQEFGTLPSPLGFEGVPPPAFDILPPPPGFDDVPPYRDPPSYEELHFNKKIRLKYCTERNAASALKETSSKSESINLNSRDFVTPAAKYWRQSLLAMLFCERCKHLFSSVRLPHIIISGTTACTECTSQIYGISFLKAKQSHPLNTEYISAVQNLLYSLKIFHSENPFCSELNRGIYKDTSSKKINNLHWDLRLKMLRYEECLEKLRHLIFSNKVALKQLIAAIRSADLCKNIMLKSTPLDLKLFSLLDTLDYLLTFRRCLDISVEDYGEEDEWLVWNKMIETPMSIVLDSRLLESVFLLRLDLFLFQDLADRRFYSRVCATKNTFYLDAFTPTYPLVSSRSLGKLARFDPNALKDIANFYFEIEISGGSPDYRPFPCRYQVTLIHKNISWHTSYLFLGYENCGFLGAEIEVTEEKIIFNHYLRNGLPDSGNSKKAEMWPEANTFKPIRHGMVVSENAAELNKLSIFKYSDFSKKVCFIIGSLNPAGLGNLRKIPLGKHKISACGIFIFIKGKE